MQQNCKVTDPRGYNERLFSGKGLRSYLHHARFHWFADVVREFDISCRHVIEIGCYDGKLLDWMPITPERYLGIDANWEGGLDIARQRYAGADHISFIEAGAPAGLLNQDEHSFTLGVAMETLEHLDDADVTEYLQHLTRLVDGYVLISVPNEKGIVFLIKWLIKKIIFGDAEQYTLKEVAAATLGRMTQVARNQHKGFDYSKLIGEAGNYFEIVRVDSIPLKVLPLCLSFNVGIVARSRRPHQS